MKKPLLSRVLLCALCGALFAADTPLHLNVLAVGDSYDRNMPNFIPQYLKNSGKGHTLDITVIYMGGSSLEDHWRSVLELSGKAPAAH